MRRLRRPLIPMAVVGLSLLASLLPASVNAGSLPTAHVNLGVSECGVQGDTTTIDQDLLRIKVFTAAGKRVASYTADTSSDGEYSVGCPGPALKPGWVVKFYDNTATHPFRTFTMPRLTLTIDRVHDELRGTATGGVAEVTLFPGSCEASMRECTGLAVEQVSVNAATHAYKQVRAENVTGLWSASVGWFKGGDQVRLFQLAPRLVVTPGSAVVSGAGGAPGSKVSVRVRRGQQVGTGSGRAGYLARFRATIKHDGVKMQLKVGDAVSSTIPGTPTLTVPPSSLTFTLDSVSGACFPGGAVTVQLYGANGAFADIGSTVAGLDGSWLVTPMAVSAGYTIKAWCANGKGDAVFRSLVAN